MLSKEAVDVQVLANQIFHTLSWKKCAVEIDINIWVLVGELAFEEIDVDPRAMRQVFLVPSEDQNIKH